MGSIMLIVAISRVMAVPACLKGLEILSVGSDTLGILDK